MKTTRKTVTLWRWGHNLLVKPPVPALAEHLATRCHVAVPDDRHGIRIVEQRTPLTWERRWRDQRMMATYAGLEAKAVQVLEGLGYTIKVCGGGPDSFPPPQPAAGGGAWVDQAMLEFMQSHERGVIRYRPGRVNIAKLVAQVTNCFPEEKILVVATRRNDVWRLQRDLERLDVPAGWAVPETSVRGKTVVICTYLGLGMGAASAERRTLVLYLNPAEARRWIGQEGLAHIGRARLFGLLPIGAALPRSDEDFVAAVFGQDSIAICEHGRVSRPVDVVLLPARLSRNSPSLIDHVAVRRTEVWHHPVRNRRIAALARLLAKEDPRRLDTLPRPAATVAWDHLGGRIVVLAENIEQGLTLARHLPKWPLLVAETVESAGLSKHDRARLTVAGSEPRTLLCHAIVTVAALPQVGWFDILVRADAGIDAPSLGDLHGRGDFGMEDDRLLIVDLDDRHHPLAQRWTKSRKAAYAGQGWNVIGGPPVQATDCWVNRNVYRQPVLAYQASRRQPWISGQQHTAAHHYRCRRRRREKQFRREAGRQVTLAEVADRDNIFEGFQQLRREGGPAPGVDAIRLREISPADFGQIASALAGALNLEIWRPQVSRPVPIPKPGTTERRLLKLPVSLDRLVGKALHRKLQPVLEKIFLRNSFGFRPRRSVWQMIGELEATMDKYSSYVLAAADVRKAFDTVPICAALEAHQRVLLKQINRRRPFLAPEVLRLIETVLRGHDNHDVGIDQGGCYSPDALNIFLHVVHDVPLDAADEVLLWFRYVDNLTYLVQSMSEGYRAITRVQTLLGEAKLSLKEESIQVIDLNQTPEPIRVLGFGLSRPEGRLRIELSSIYLTQLREHLVQALETSDPNKTAGNVVRQWIDTQGPAFENGVAHLADILHLGRRLGFRELPRIPELRERWGRAYQRWRRCREACRRRVLRRKVR